MPSIDKFILRITQTPKNLYGLEEKKFKGNTGQEGVIQKVSFAYGKSVTGAFDGNLASECQNCEAKNYIPLISTTRDENGSPIGFTNSDTLSFKLKINFGKVVQLTDVIDNVKNDYKAGDTIKILNQNLTGNWQGNFLGIGVVGFVQPDAELIVTLEELPTDNRPLLVSLLIGSIVVFLFVLLFTGVPFLPLYSRKYRQSKFFGHINPLNNAYPQAPINGFGFLYGYLLLMSFLSIIIVSVRLGDLNGIYDSNKRPSTANINGTFPSPGDLGVLFGVPVFGPLVMTYINVMEVGCWGNIC